MFYMVSPFAMTTGNSAAFPVKTGLAFSETVA